MPRGNEKNLMVEEKSHSDACTNAKSKDCNCWCNGKYHGRKSGNLTDEIERSIKNLAVGDIVIIYDGTEKSGSKAFIEEIVRDPDERTGLLWQHGKYSLYGFLNEKLTYDTTTTSRYFGDYLGYTLEPTGTRMTVELLEEYAQIEPKNKGIRRDIEVVKKNLGRKSGRNEV